MIIDNFITKFKPMDKIISQISNGRVFVCGNCDKIHIEFYNFLYSFNEEEYCFFKSRIEQIDGCYYESQNAQLSYKRKIVVPLGHRNVSMLLNQSELEELQLLLSQRCNVPDVNCFISVKEMGMPIGSN